MISGFYTPFIFPSFCDEDVLFTSLSTPPPSAPTLNAIKLLASLTHFPKGNAAVSSKLATAGLCMIMPIYSVWWFIPVLRCVVQSWVNIHSFQSVFPSLLSKCHFPFVQHSFPASSMIPGGIQKNHSSKNISQGSHRHPPSYPYFCCLSSPRRSWAVTSPLFCLGVGRGRDIG